MGETMTVIGYGRVSTSDQDLTIQESALKAAGCEVIRTEKKSGTSTNGRDRRRQGTRDEGAWQVAPNCRR